MGSKHSSQVIVSPAPSDISDESSSALVCDPCINLEKPAKAWCNECNIYLCFNCMQTHIKIHKLVTGRNLPETRPRPKFLTNDSSAKQVIAVATLYDSELAEDDSIPKREKTFRGCVCIDEHYVTIGYQNMRVYDKQFKCIGEIYFATSPNSICYLGNKVVVSFDRKNDFKTDQETAIDTKDRTTDRSAHDIQIYQLKPPNCLNPDSFLKKHVGFFTEGECFSTGICPVKDRQALLIAVGLEMDEDKIELDIRYKIQILKSNGQIIHQVEFNPRGEPAFDGRFFICGSMTFGELCITELKERRVRGISIKTGKTIYEFEGGFPQGVTVDSDDNLYVYNDAALYWIPAVRNKIYYMLQNYNKKAARKETSMKCAISFDSETRNLYVTNSEKDKIEVYRIT